jgi:hypothetical protein
MWPKNALMAMARKLNRPDVKEAKKKAVSQFKNFSGARLSQPQRVGSQIDFEYNFRGWTCLPAAAGTAALRKLGQYQ